jgi:hypothetical protein
VAERPVHRAEEELMGRDEEEQTPARFEDLPHPPQRRLVLLDVVEHVRAYGGVEVRPEHVCVELRGLALRDADLGEASKPVA